MPKFPRKAARLTLLPAAVLTAMAVAGPPVLGQGTTDEEVTGPTIVIQPTGGRPPAELTLADALEGGSFAAPIGTTYRVRRGKGPGQPVRIPSSDRAASIEEILSKAGLRNGYRYITIPRPTGRGSVVLSRERIATGDDPPAIFLDDDEQLWFIGSSSVGEQEINASNYFRVSGATFGLAQTNKSQLTTVALSCDKTEIDKGDRLTCKARAAGAPGDAYRFEFDFGEGELEVKNENPYFGYAVEASHVYEEAKDVSVTVTVTTNGDTKRPDTPRGVTVSDPTPPVDTSSGVPPANSTPYTPDFTPTDSGSSSTPVPQTDYDFDDSFPATADGNTVEGNLLASLDAPAASGSATSSSAQAAQAVSATFDPPDTDSELSPAAWAGLGAFALMGTGAMLESGRRPRLRSLRHLSLRRR